MEQKSFWNEAAKCGAIVGALLSVSFLLETMISLSGSMSLYALMVVECILVVVLHYYLLHRFTRQRAVLRSVEEGFTFGEGYGYVLAVSGFAGLLLGVVRYLYVNVIIGYPSYLDRFAEAMASIMQSGGGVGMEGLFTQMMDQIRAQPEPSIFSTVFNGVLSSLLFGLFFGLIVAGVLSRAPKPFDTTENNG